MMNLFSSYLFVLFITKEVSAFSPLSPSLRGGGATAAAGKSVSGSTTTSLDAGAAIYYSTSTGNTETVAGYIAKAAGVDSFYIEDAKDGDLQSYDSLIVGAPTWHTGADEQRSGTAWDDFLYDKLPGIQLEGKKVAVFGVGDQESYGDNFCDAAGELFDLFQAKGCKMYGFTSTDGYNHSDSKALRDGKFCGLMCDEDNQYDLSEDRAKDWIDQLKKEGFF